MSEGKIIVLEGLDGSGKQTQADLLYRKLLDSGCNTRRVSFPVYSSPASAPIRMYLNGEIGDDPKDVSPYSASTFYAIDRYISYRTDWGKDYENGALIVADRYTSSNAIYQCAGLPQNEWDGYLRWLEDLEHEKMSIPRAYQTIYLAVNRDVSQRLMSKRYSGDESKKDILERNNRFLAICQETAAYCADRFGWSVLDCSGDKDIKPVEEIADDILNAVQIALSLAD